MKLFVVMLLGTTIVLAVPGFPLAQGEPANQSYPSISKGIASGNLHLRSSPPSGPFNLKGEIVGSINSGQEVIVKEKRTLKNFFGSESWLKVQVADANVHGWVYNGITDEGKCYIDFIGCKLIDKGEAM